MQVHSNSPVRFGLAPTVAASREALQKERAGQQSGLDILRNAVSLQRQTGNQDAFSLVESVAPRGHASRMTRLFESQGLLKFTEIGTTTMATPDGKGSKVVPIHQNRLTPAAFEVIN